MIPMITRFGAASLKQIGKVKKAILKKSDPKAYKKQMTFAKWKKSKWQKPAPLIGRKFPTYTRKELAIDVGVLGAATGIGLAIRGKRKKKKET